MTLGTNCNEIPIKLQQLWHRKIKLKMSPAQRWPFCFGVLTGYNCHQRLDWWCARYNHHVAISLLLDRCGRDFKCHDDVIKWKRLPRYWPFVRGIQRSPVNFPHKGQWRGALLFSLICTLNKRLSKQSLGWWFQTPMRSLWRHYNEFSGLFSEWYFQYGQQIWPSGEWQKT